MTLTYLVLLILPIVAFAIADTFAGLKWGIIAAISLAMLAFVAIFWLQGGFELSSTIEPILILVLGLAALRFNDSRWFKFQPVVANAAIAILLAYSQIFDTPLLVKYLPLMKTMLPPETQELVENPIFLKVMSNTSHHLIYFLIAHGLLVAWAAMRKSNWVWVIAKLAAYPLLIIFTIFELVPLMSGVSIP